MITGMLLWWLEMVANAPIWYFVADGFIIFFSLLNFLMSIIKSIKNIIDQDL